MSRCCLVTLVRKGRERPRKAQVFLKFGVHTAVLFHVGNTRWRGYRNQLRAAIRHLSQKQYRQVFRTRAQPCGSVTPLQLSVTSHTQMLSFRRASQLTEAGPKAQK